MVSQRRASWISTSLLTVRALPTVIGCDANASLSTNVFGRMKPPTMFPESMCAFILEWPMYPPQKGKTAGLLTDYGLVLARLG